MFGALAEAGFDVSVRNHAGAILSVDFSEELAELETALLSFRITPAEIISSGGGEAQSTQRLRRQLNAAGWVKHSFRIQTTIDGVARDAGTSHEIDHIKRTERGTLALEIEWNNKDPFFDRDLENFQRLHARSVISLGIVVTRGAALQAELHGIVARFLRERQICDEVSLKEFGMKDRTERQREAVEKAMSLGADFVEAFSKTFVADKYGVSTTHWSKLIERAARGVGNPCPLVLIGLPVSAVEGYSAASPEL